MKTTTCLVLLAGTLAFGEHASAAVTMFHFGDPVFLAHTNVQGQTFLPTTGSPDLNVTIFGSKLGATPQLGSGGQAYLVDYGLGVLDPNAPNGDRSTLLNRVHTGGTLGGEYLRLVFNQPVQVTQAKFAFAGQQEKFDLAVDGVNLDVPKLFGSDEIVGLSPAGQYTNTVNFPQTMPFGTVWDFIAPTGSDTWNLENVTVIPEPTTLLVWSVLAASMTGLRRFRRRR